MPPISVKNSISPATSILSTAGSLPGMLVVLGEDPRLDASLRLVANRRPHLHEPPWSELDSDWLWYCVRLKSAARSDRAKTQSTAQRGTGDKRSAREASSQLLDQLPTPNLILVPTPNLPLGRLKAPTIE